MVIPIGMKPYHQCGAKMKHKITKAYLANITRTPNREPIFDVKGHVAANISLTAYKTNATVIF